MKTKILLQDNGYFIVSLDNYYYEDKGVSDDRSIYKPILGGLQKILQP